MVKSKTKVTESNVQKRINGSYKKLAIAVGFAVSICALAIGAWQMPRTQIDANNKETLPKEKSAEEIINERVPRLPPRGPDETPSAGVLAKPSVSPGSGVEIKVDAPRKPAKPTLAPLDTPTKAMMAGVTPKKETQALAVDAAGYATLPDGKRVKINKTATAAGVPTGQLPTGQLPATKPQFGPLQLDGQGYATLPSGKKVKVELGISKQEQKSGLEGQGGKSEDDLDKVKPLHDAKGYLLLQNGERKSVDTSGFPVDANGMMMLPNGKKMKAGEEVYLRLKVPPDLPKLSPALKAAP